MPLDPDIESFLDLVALGHLSGKQRPMHEMSVTEARAMFEQSSLILEGDSYRPVWTENVLVPAEDGTALPVRLYAKHPPSPENPWPLLLFLHGGGYVVGSLDSHDALCRDLAYRSGWAVLAVGYRLAPEHKFPTALHDALTAVAWLAAEGAAYGLDRQRLVLAGDSVGGSLATILALLAAREPARMPLAPLLQILIYPVTDAAGDYPSRLEHGSGRLLETASLEWFYHHYETTPADRYDWRFSPLRAPDLCGVAPALLLLAAHDPLLDEGLAYSQRLRSAGVPVEVEVRPGMVHDFLRMPGVTDEAARVRELIARRLDKLR